ncbi:MAG: transporter [Candidatus Eiseniibacteriota bacterium]
MRKSVIVLLLLALGAWSGVALACSQCECGSPTPPGFLLDTAYQRFSYGLEDRYSSKENALADEPGFEEQWEHRISGLFYYRPSDRVGMQLRVPYVIKKNDETVEGESPVRTNSDGFGDVALRARFEVARFASTNSPPRTLAIIADATTPTGSNNMKDDSGERLEAHLQPGTGVWAGMGGLALDVALPGSALSASALYRVNGTSDYGYHYGDTWLLNAGYARTLSRQLEGALELNARSAKRDVTEEGPEDPNSGGSLLYIAPSVRYLLGGAASLQLLVQVPVAQDLHGDQTEHTNARLGFVLTGL